MSLKTGESVRTAQLTGEGEYTFVITKPSCN